MLMHASKSIKEKSEKSLLTLRRRYFYLCFYSCFLIPLAPFYFFESFKTHFVFSFLSILLALGTSGLLLHFWEKKMRRAAAFLIQSKVDALKQQADETQSTSEKLLQSKMILEETKQEHALQVDLLQSSVSKSKEEVRQLHMEMDKKLEQMRHAYLEFDDLRKNFNRLEDECIKSKEEAEKERTHKESLIAEYQKTIAEQRQILEKKQHYIFKLEEKVKDLMGEIRSLLQLEEAPNSRRTPEVSPAALLNTSYDLGWQLQRYVEKVEEMTGVDHLGYVGGGNPRFLDLSLESYAVDLRRLFDSFENETPGILFIYSLKEKKFLFVNQYVKTALGYGPEKFMKDFPQFVKEGYYEFKNALSKLMILKEAQTHLILQERLGKELGFECMLSLISKGPFTQHAIGILSLSI